MNSTDTPSTSRSSGWLLKRIGPGLVTACVVIGPGSILTSSNVGAKNGFELGWVIIAACLFMMVYTSLAAKLGVVAQQSTATLVTERAGRLLAVIIGMGVFFIASAFQFGNNLGVDSAFRAFAPERYATSSTDGGFNPFDYTVVLFNALSLAFLFAFRNLYKWLERLMAVFVGVMLVAFALNLWFARPDLGELLRGLLPQFNRDKLLDISLLGLVGTTFVVAAAYYQSYLVRFRGWTTADLPDGMIDARVSASIMALITLMLMSTSAAVLRGQTLNGVEDVANSLQPLFGDKGKVLFCIGLFSAAYSSFIVNSMIGGFILADALGLGSTPQDKWPRLLTAAVLLIGMGVAMYTIRSGAKPVAAIVAAQAVTVVAAPLVAGTLWWLSTRSDIMGTHRPGPVMNAFAGIGFLLLLAMAFYTAIEKVWPAVRGALGM